MSRMRKKLDTRFPAARIKKIMQADEDVGKIAAATPVLMSKALEMFLQDLLDKTYDVTAARGVKTVSTNHLRTCIQSNSVFDFLKEVATRVPDLGGESECNEEKQAGHGHRRRVKDEEQESSGEDVKRMRIDSVSAASTSGQKHAAYERNGHRKASDSKAEHRVHPRGSRTPKLESEDRLFLVPDSKPKREDVQDAGVVKMDVCKVETDAVVPRSAKVECAEDDRLRRENGDGRPFECPKVEAESVDECCTTKRTLRDFDLNVGLDDTSFDDNIPEEKPVVVEMLKEKDQEPLVVEMLMEKQQHDCDRETTVGGGVNGKFCDILVTPRAVSNYDEDDYDCEDDEDG